ncbi:MAG TPA: sodium ion-translocating decarboxylase subunit beta, partial [Spirochaetia bacterium]|nr:sodium ion-translocating decarboxylase subunit beta [Spirochaetia bacterium]
MIDKIIDFINSSGFAGFFNSTMMISIFGLQIPGELIMLFVACLLLYLGIVKKFEPLLLIPIAFGMLLVNLPLSP